MPPVFPSPGQVAQLQAQTIRAALAAAPGSPFQTRLLAAATLIGTTITPLSQSMPTAAEARFLQHLAGPLHSWIDIHFGNGGFAGALQALTAGLEQEAA